MYRALTRPRPTGSQRFGQSQEADPSFPASRLIVCFHRRRQRQCCALRTADRTARNSQQYRHQGPSEALTICMQRSTYDVPRSATLHAFSSPVARGYWTAGVSALRMYLIRSSRIGSSPDV